MTATDILIIGSGIGGATAAAALATTGRKILILERGEHIQPTDKDRDAKAIFADGYFRPDETWLDGKGRRFNPGNYYYVGGNSKLYGAVLLRYRREDFKPIAHLGGLTKGWPISYEDLEPYYSKAEQMFSVRGEVKDDASEPLHSSPYPFLALADEDSISDFRSRLQCVGLHPSSLPLGIEIDKWLERAKTPWDAFPNTGSGKVDAETGPLAQALMHQNVSLRTNAKADRLTRAQGNAITGVELSDGQQITANLVVLAAGAVQSAALLLASRCEAFPNGLANKSDQVGRNFMNHNCSALLALHPFRLNTAIYQKTLMVNDYYLTGGPDGHPLGNIQLLGKISGEILKASSPLPRVLANWIARRSVDIYAMSEDLPDPESRVTLVDGDIRLDWKRSNWEAHRELVKCFKGDLKKAGYPIVLSKTFDKRTPSHQCGTARMGGDPTDSVVDTNCQSHDHPNLYITDASVLPTSAAVNPALTIAALSLRAAAHISARDAQGVQHA